MELPNRAGLTSDESFAGLGDLVDQPDAPQDHGPQAPDIDDLRRKYRSAWDASTDERDFAYIAVDYYHGNQLNSEIIAEMKRRKQAATYYNKIRPAIDGVLGLLDSGETDPQAIGRNEDDEEAATIVTEILRYLNDENQFSNQIKQDVSFDLLTYGIGITTVEVNTDTGDAAVSHIPYNEFFYDPYSLRHDFRDAKFLGRAKFVDIDEADRMFPEHQGMFSGISSAFTGQGPEEQQLQRKVWIDDRFRVLLVEMYFIDDTTGHWMHVNFCHAGILDFGPSAYLDDQNNPVCPIIATSYQIDREGTRYGMIKDMVPLQDAINNRISKMLYVTNAAQVEAVDDNALPTERNLARTEASRPDGAMPRGWKKISQQDTFEGNNILLQNDMQAIERMAPSPALLGRAGGANESGRARQVLQQAGLSELARAFARWENWELECYRQMWYRALQFMDEPRMLRVTDETGSRKSLIINQPISDPQTGQPVIDPQTGQPAMSNHLALMDMDINIKTVRQADTLRGEAAQNLLDWSAKTGVSLLDPSFELVIELSDIPNKPLIMKKYQELKGQQEQKQAQAEQAQQAQAQAAQQMQQAAIQGKNVKDAAEAQKNHALAEQHTVKTQLDEQSLAYRSVQLQHGVNPDGKDPA